MTGRFVSTAVGDHAGIQAVVCFFVLLLRGRTIFSLVFLKITCPSSWWSSCIGWELRSCGRPSRPRKEAAQLDPARPNYSSRGRKVGSSEIDSPSDIAIQDGSIQYFPVKDIQQLLMTQTLLDTLSYHDLNNEASRHAGGHKIWNLIPKIWDSRNSDIVLPNSSILI